MPRCPSHRPHGRLLHWLLAPLLTAAALLAAGEWFEWPFLRAPLERAAARALGRTVVIAPPFGVRLLGAVRLRAGGLSIGPPQDGSPTPADAQGQPRDLLRAAGARVVLPYSTVWRAARGGTQALAITLLDVDQIELNLLRDAQGRSNWRLGPPAGAAAVATPASAPALPNIGTLTVRRGEIRLDDAPLQLKLQASVQTEEGAPQGAGASPRTGLDVQATGSHRGLPLKARLQSSGLLPLARADAGADADADAALAVPIKIDLRVGRAHLRVDGTVSDLLHLGALRAAFELSGPSLAAVGDAVGLTLPTTAAFSMRGSTQKAGAVWSAAVQALSIGSSRLRGDFRYDTAPALPLLTGTLAGANLALVDLGPAVGAGAPGVAAAVRPGRVLPQREFDIPSLRAMDADVMLKLDRVDLGTPLLEPLVPLRGRVQLQQGVLGVQELVASTSDGELRGALTVDARPQVPLWTADLRWSGIQLERFLKARNPRSREAQATSTTPKPAAATRGYVSGVLGGSAQVRGKGRSTAAVLGSLDGQARLWLRQGAVSHLIVEAAGIDIAESLGLLLAGDKPLPVRCAVAQLTLRDGRAVPDVALLDTGDTTLLVSGQLSFADESLALVLTARPHDFSPLSLRAPVRVVGSFSAPAVRLDTASMGLRLAGAAALGAVAPLLALLPLIDLGEEDRNVCQDTVARVQNKPRAKPVAAPRAPSSAPTRAPTRAR